MTTDTLQIALGALEKFPFLYLFPIRNQKKTPPFTKDNLNTGCSNDPEQIKKWHARTPGCNWGVATEKSGLIPVDVDLNKGKVGMQTFNSLQLIHTFPPTFTVETPSGGWHLWYKGEHRFALGKSGFGQDVDVPQYILLPGCTVTDQDGALIGEYRQIDPLLNSPDEVWDGKIADAPAWFYDVLPKKKEKTEVTKADDSAAVVELDQPAHIEWAIHYLKHDALDAIEGNGGERNTWLTAATLREHGISEDEALDLMDKYYNVPGRCDPLWEIDGENGLRKKINNAYTYAKAAPGEKTAEAEMPALTAAEEKQLVAMQMKDAKVKSKTALDKKIADQKLALGSTRLNDIMQEWVWIIGQKRFVRRSDGTIWDRDMFDSAFNYIVAPKHPSISKKLFAQAGGIKKLDSIIFRPGQSEFDRKLYNTWRKSEVVPAEGDTTIWNEHLNYLFQNEEDRDHVLNWMAWVYQNQHLKPNHALLIVGEEHGTGKSFVARVFEQLIGVSNTQRPKNSSLKGDFNGWAARCKLAIIEELMQIGRREVANELRDIITEPFIEVNMKNVAAFQIENYMALLAITNHLDAMPLEDSDRRWLVVRTHATKRGSAYYQRLFSILRDPAALAAIAHELQNRALGEYDAHLSAPVNEAKLDMIEAGMGDLEAWMLEHSSEPPFSRRLVSIQDVVDVLPKRLERTPRLGNVIGSFLRRRLRGEPLGTKRIPGGGRVKLWALNGSAAIMKQAGEAVGPMYVKERAGSKKQSEDDAGDDFVDEVT